MDSQTTYGAKDDDLPPPLTADQIAALQGETIPEGMDPREGEYRDVFLDVAQQYPGTTEGFDQFVQAMQEAGIDISPTGQSGSVMIGDTPIDIMRDYRGGGEGWWWGLPSTGDTKTGDTKTGDTKTGDTKTGDTKTGDTKTGDTKTGDNGNDVSRRSGGDLPRFNQDAVTDAQFAPQDTDPPAWLGDLYPHTDEIPYLPQSFEDLTRVEVGADPLSQMSNKILANLGTTGGVAATPLAGATEQSLIDTLQNYGQGPMSELQSQVLGSLSDVIENRGRISDPQRDAMEIEAIRSPLDALRQSQLAEGQAAMARRGLLGSGPEADYMQRLESRLAPEYTRAAQLLEIDRRDRENDRLEKAMELGARTENEREMLRTNRLNSALQLATGMSEEQSRNLLATVRTVSDRQQMLNDIALSSLDRNMEWNKFLAEHQLQRHQVLEAIQEGRFNAILPLLQSYLTGANIVGTGFREPEE